MGGPLRRSSLGYVGWIGPWMNAKNGPSETRTPIQGKGGCFGGFRRRNEGCHGREPVDASLDGHPGNNRLIVFHPLQISDSARFIKPEQFQAGLVE